MQKCFSLFAATGLLAVFFAFAQNQKPSKAQNEQELRGIELENARYEQQNDASKMSTLADDWVCLMNLGQTVLSKAEFLQNVRQNFAAHDNGASPYTIEKKNLRVDLFEDTAVVTYIKEYRQTTDTAQFFDEDDTDVFTRTSNGWRLRLTKISPVQSHAQSN